MSRVCCCGFWEMKTTTDCTGRVLSEQLPKDEQYNEKAKYLYSLMGEITDEIHALDTNHRW